MAKSRRRHRRLLTPANIGLAALALVTVGTGAVLLKPTPPAPVEASVQQYYENMQTQKPTLAPKIQKKAAFLGDSYTAGEGGDASHNYVGSVASIMNWNPILMGQGGTGYTNPGQKEQNEGTYLDRVPAVVAAKPDFVVVQGSTNDHYTVQQTRDAAAAVYQALKAGLPNAKIVAVGPLTPPGSVPAEVDNVRAALQQATSAAGIEFIDPAAEKWLQPSDGLFADAFHPNSAGHQKMGELLAADLKKLGLTS